MAIISILIEGMEKSKNMRKLTIISVCMAFGGLYAGELPNYQAMQSQITDLQSQIDMLKADKESQAQENTKHQDKQSINGFLFWDQDLSTPLGAADTSAIPLTFLKQRDERPQYSLTVAGKLEIDASQWWGSSLHLAGKDAGNYQSGRGLYINEADLYMVSNLGKYIQADLTLMDSQASTPGVRDAFLTFGNLSVSPIYLTIGKNRLTFGRFYDGNPWASGLVQGLFRPGFDTVSMNLGYYKNGLNLNLAAFQADTQSSNFMLSAFYDGTMGKFNYGANAGYMYNWVGTGMDAASNVNNENYGNVIYTNGTNGQMIDDSRNGVVNIEGYLGYDIYTLYGGWAGTTQKKSYSNNAYIGAWYAKAQVAPVIADRSTQFAFSYQQAYNTQNAPFPISGDAANSPMIYGVQSQVMASISRPVFYKSNMVSIEYAYLETYTRQHSSAITLDITTYF